ncbi:hypothetical protein PVK06_014003 [Gossypium arboreum]|uniref:Uncharacterized protein n=1 Tax=Gossypium arboreum TaxID=29729 RepID=A0ABR0PTM4_GOSAR|nr:hypothetical protein PVK06_014003 [Gossypium arboreum]
MSELKQPGGKIALANKILIPGIAARKFPAMDVIYSDGRKSKLPVVFDASGVDASKLAVPEASLVCLSFRANSRVWFPFSILFMTPFSESKSVQLYEVSFIDSWLLCLNPIKRLLLRFMRKSSDGAKDALQRHVVYSFGDHYYFRKELKILNLLTGYFWLAWNSLVLTLKACWLNRMNKFTVLRDLNFVTENLGVEFFKGTVVV